MTNKIRSIGLMCLILFFCITYGFSAEKIITVREICGDYIEAWKKFYPSQAFSRGFLDSIYDYEDFSEENIKHWLRLNKEIFKIVSQPDTDITPNDRIDARLLKIQIRSEIDKWENDRPHKNSSTLYTRTISQAINRIIDSPHLIPSEKIRIIVMRLDAVDKICLSTKNQLESSSPNSIENSLNILEESARFYANILPEKVETLAGLNNPEIFRAKCYFTSSQIQNLIDYIKNHVSPRLTDSDSTILGRERYARNLKLLTDSDLTPEQLEAMALKEIHLVRNIMVEAASDYLSETYPGEIFPKDLNDLVNRALKDMEQSHPSSEQEYLKFWKGLAQSAEKFIRENKIATLPDNQTLSIVLAPESAGPMTRIGWVSSAPPFHPNPWTTIYLPTIPDSFPENERKEFWRSFNNYFTRFIVIHELFPGHYIQNKINRENPHSVRILFPYALYSEGWATLCEKVALDAGWDNNNKLTRLAHLRKRLENANRAYTSVQVHCRRWNQEKVLEFSIATSLLAPQFAKSLWGRLKRSPLQITTYFLGTQKFTKLYETEKKRLGKEFRNIIFMDTILRAGPIPLDEFFEIFKNSVQGLK